MAVYSALGVQVSHLFSSLSIHNKHVIFQRIQNEVKLNNAAEVKVIANIFFRKIAASPTITEDQGSREMYEELSRVLGNCCGKIAPYSFRDAFVSHCEREFERYSKTGNTDGKKKALCKTLTFLFSKDQYHLPYFLEDCLDVIESFRKRNASLSNIEEQLNHKKDNLIQINTEQREKIVELQQSVDERHDLIEHLRKENAAISSNRDEIKEMCNQEKENYIQTNAAQIQKILDLQQSVDVTRALVEQLREENTGLLCERDEIEEKLTHEKNNLNQTNTEQMGKILELQQSVDERHALIEKLREENAKLSSDQRKVKDDFIHEKQSLAQTIAEQQKKILEIQQSVLERHTLIDHLNQLRISMTAVETRLEERSAQHDKLEKENTSLRGELSDMMQGLICSSRTSSSESDAMHSPWEVIPSDWVSTQSTQVAKGGKKTRRSLKNRNRKTRPAYESFSIPETAGEYQD